MVTILPIELDEDFVRDAVQRVAADRIHNAMQGVGRHVAELRAGSVVEREEWEQSVRNLAAALEAAGPVLDYARSFVDQNLSGDEDEPGAEP